MRSDVVKGTMSASVRAREGDGRSKNKQKINTSTPKQNKQKPPFSVEHSSSMELGNTDARDVTAVTQHVVCMGGVFTAGHDAPSLPVFRLDTGSCQSVQEVSLSIRSHVACVLNHSSVKMKRCRLSRAHSAGL